MTKDVIFNHDGFGLLCFLAATEMRERDAAELLALPLIKQGISVIDWSILSTAHHNCRTRHNFAFDGVGAGRRIDKLIGQVITHYNEQPLDLLDIVIKHGHENGVQVFGDLRLNHSSLDPDLFLKVPGRNFADGRCWKKDFRDEQYHLYLTELLEDILAKDVDGIVLDFERKAPFFPNEVDEDERLAAGRAFLRGVRKITDKPIAVRIAHETAKGRPQGQDPLGWMAEGLIDIVIPATHNHEPDDFRWGFAQYAEAAERSSRSCRVWPQIWPTGVSWAAEGSANKVRHTADEVRQRAQVLVNLGADGVYFFNFCCDGWPAPPRIKPEEFSDIFPDIKDDEARSRAIFLGLREELNEGSKSI